jgi:cytochrome c-type biogenesis protein CcsB
MAKSELAPLEPPYQSAWLYVHVVFAWFAFGSYLVASILAALLLLQSKAAPEPAAAIEGTPENAAGRFDELSLRFLIFGFITDTVMIASGAIWAHGLWGRYWGWDPVETWSLITWLIYGTNLHLRLTLGWRGRRAAWLAVVSVASVVITFFGVGFAGDLHTQIMKNAP